MCQQDSSQARGSDEARENQDPSSASWEHEPHGFGFFIGTAFTDKSWVLLASQAFL